MRVRRLERPKHGPVVVMLLALSGSAMAQDTHVHESATHTHGKLGTVVFPNSGARAAQPDFLRGVALLHSFEYETARESFAAARKTDADFALAYWMEALAYRYMLWGIEFPDSARSLLTKLAPTPAQRLAKAKTPRERGYGAAVEALFTEGTEQQRVRAFADSMRSLIVKYPDDLETYALAAIATLGVSMQLPDSLSEPVVNEAIRYAEHVRQKNDDHPGALHYLIHSYDHPARAARGLDVARAYAKTAPASEHAVHMPSHIFIQVGLWDDVVASNESAYALSRAEVTRRKVSPTSTDFHSLAWLQYAYLQQGRFAEARALIDSARVVLKGIDMTGADHIDERYAISDLEFAYAHETGDWSVAPKGASAPGTIGSSTRAQNFAMRDRYARALSAAMRGDTVAAASAVPNLRGRLALQVRALLAQKRGAHDEAIQLLKEAVTIENTQTPYGPSYGPPSLEMLGEAYMKAGQPALAAQAYAASLKRRPNRRIALAGLAAAGQTAPQTQTIDLANSDLIDLTHAYNAQTIYWPTSPSRFRFDTLSAGMTAGGYYYSSYAISTPEHGGTHLDAPVHFHEGGNSSDVIPLSRLMAPAVVIDVSVQAERDRNYRLNAADVGAWEKQHGRIPAGSIVLLRTGWSRYWPNVKAYMGDDTPNDASRLSFPSYGVDAARVLVDERKVAALGVDVASIDYGKSTDFMVHRVAGAANVAGFENLTNLDLLPATGAFVIALPMKIEKGSGGPLRAVAIVPKR